MPTACWPSSSIGSACSVCRGDRRGQLRCASTGSSKTCCRYRARGVPAHEPIDVARFLSRFLPEFVVQSGAQRHRIAMSLETDAPILLRLEPAAPGAGEPAEQCAAVCLRRARAVRIAWRSWTDGRLEFSVADDGPGLGPARRGHAFEPFFTTESRGTGLGLYLARELSALNGAGIRYQSIRNSDRYSGAFMIDPRRSDAAKGAMKQVLNS